MNIRTRALLETAKIVGFGLLIGILFNFVIDYFGAKIAAIVLLSVITIWFIGFIYKLNLSRLKWEDESKNTMV